MKVFDFEQCSPRWFQVRKGIPTSSEFGKIITCTGKQSAQREKYMYRLAGERLGGIVEEGYQSFAMIRGKEKEEEAKNLYELIRGPIQKVGFCLSDCGRFGASSDGLIGKDGVFELKCPEIQTHVGYMLNKDEVPGDYFQQTQGEIFVTGRDYVEFMSYYPGLPPLIIREEAHKPFQRLLEGELELFCDELDALVKELS